MEKRIAAVVTVCDSWPLADEALQYLIANSNRELTDVYLVDNGSFLKCPDDLCINHYRLIKFDTNIGVNAIFHRTIPNFENYDLVAHFHCDVMIREDSWDQRVIQAFDKDPKLALVGFLGSNEIDGAGGRGLGTNSSYMGYEYKTGNASRAEIHGRRTIGTEAAAVVDHMSMIFKLDMLKQLPPQEESGYAPHHFYDRILCCEILKRGWHIATMGIECDHFGGGTGLCKVPHVGPELGVVNRDELYKRWLTEKNIPFKEGDNLDLIVYQNAERIFLSTWRDERHFIPVKVAQDYTVTHTKLPRGYNAWLE